jgi:hypothetical protein
MRSQMLQFVDYEAEMSMDEELNEGRDVNNE